MLVRQLQKYTGIGCMIILAACGSSSQQPVQGPPPPVNVTTYTVEATNATYYDEYPGTVTALNQVELRPQVSGYITGIYFKDGNPVKQGQRLYSIDQQQYEANY